MAHLTLKLTPDALGKIGAVFGFHFKDTQRTATLDGSGREPKGWFQGSPESHGLAPSFEVTITEDDFAQLVFGKLHPMAGMATGRMKLKGNIKEALKLDRLLK